MIHRRNFLTALAACLTLFKGWGSARAQEVARCRITFLLTNDLYLMGETPGGDGQARGGFARLAAVVKSERARGGNVIFAHAGDTLSPSLMSGFDRGAHIISLLNMIGPDIFVPGNHEFDFGKAVFSERMREATFPLYAANLRTADGGILPNYRDRAIQEFDGVRIGLTGCAYEHTARTSTPEDLRFTPTIRTAREQTEALRNEGADFTVVVMHADRGDSLALQAARSADLLLTGHTHDLFLNFDGLNAIVESAYDGHYVVATDVEIVVGDRAGKRVTSWWPRFRVIDTATVVPDPEVAAAVARFEADFSREMDVKIGTTAVPLDSRNATLRTREAAIGNLFADAMRAETRADVAVINGGGIRAGRLYPPGSAITRRDVLAELPFNNRIVVVRLSGRDLRAEIENGLAQMPVAGGRFPQVSGLRAEYDISRPPGSRIVSMTVGQDAVRDDAIYRVAILDFLARGGDGYVGFRDAERITPDNDALLLATEVIDYIQRIGTVTTGVEGRMTAR